MINDYGNWYQKSITVLLNASKIFTSKASLHPKEFYLWREKCNKIFVGLLSNVFMLGIILWRQNNLKIYSLITAFIYLWRHSFTSATLFFSQSETRDFVASILINYLVDLCRIQTKATCRFLCNQVTSFQAEAKLIIYIIGFLSTTLSIMWKLCWLIKCFDMRLI